MRRSFAMFLLAVFVMGPVADDALAGAKLHVTDDAEFDLGIRIQPYYVNVDRDVDGDGEWDAFTDFRMRRARLRLKATIGKYFGGFVQTEVSGGPEGALGRPARVIDAFVTIKLNRWVQFYNGINMVPVYRQNVTSSGAMLAMERPAMTYKDLSWGNRAFVNLGTGTLAMSDSKLRGEDDVRDEGITLFGTGRLGDGDASIKYYAGVYDGIQTAGEHNDRFAGRVQVNFFDTEPGYYNSAMYLGKKKTVAFGLGYDMQSAVAPDTNGDPIDYSVVTADAFLEWPVGESTLTAEAGWSQLDLGDAIAIVPTAADPARQVDWNAVQGTGYYVQAGVLFNEKWQPWAEFEQWTSDADDDTGNYSLFRVGVSYFVEGQNANLKLGFESLSTDVPITGDEDTMNTVILGTYITY